MNQALTLLQQCALLAVFALLIRYPYTLAPFVRSATADHQGVDYLAVGRLWMANKVRFHALAVGSALPL